MTEETDLKEKLFNNVFFVMISVHQWRARYNIQNASVKIANSDIDEDLLSKPHWNLLPTRWREKFTRIEGKIRNCVYRSAVLNSSQNDNVDGSDETVKFPLRGVYIVPKKNVTALFKEIKEIEQKQFEPLVKELGDDWLNVVKDIKEKVKTKPHEIWQSIFGHLPKSASDVMGRFWIEKTIVPITLNINTDLSALTGQAADEYMQDIKKYGELFTKNVADSIICGLETELKDSVDNLVNRVNEGGIIKEGTINQVKQAFEKFKAFEFIMSPELKDKMGKVAVSLGDYSVKDLNKDLKESGAQSVTANLAKHLKEVRAGCITDIASARLHGRARRNIKV